MLSSIRVIASWLACALLVAPAWAEDDSDSKRIEDVVVYGDRVESTVSDTSISITAMSEEFLTDMGIQGPNEMVNFIIKERGQEVISLDQKESAEDLEEKNSKEFESCIFYLIYIFMNLSF